MTSQFFKHLRKTKEVGVAVALFFIILVFSLLSETFLTLDTFGSIFTVSTEIGIIALGVTLLMIAGEFDLSVGSTFALCGMIFATLTNSYHLSAVLSLFVTLGAGALFGFFNGFITIKTKIPSFITTLGTMMLFRGIVLVASDGFPISALDNNEVMELFATPLGHGFKSSVLMWSFLCVLFVYVLNYHPFGNLVMATGGNEDASFSMGIRVHLIKISCFVITSMLAALAGIIQYSHLMTLSPTAGEQYELRAIAIAVIGGTALTGGVGTMKGTILGTLIMGVLASGLVQAGVSTYWFRAFVGTILVVAVIMNTSLLRMSTREA